jgi:hypothetical protein
LVVSRDLLAVLEVLGAADITPTDPAVVGQSVMATLVLAELRQRLLGLTARAVLHKFAAYKFFVIMLTSHERR